jgi:alanyl-tRNA synthetase
MKPAYPELMEAKAFITSVIENEEVRFIETLDTGLKLLNETLADIRAKDRTDVPGDIIFKLYDTYGFPVDIVRDVIRDEGDLTLDMEGFEHAMEEQRRKSRSVSTYDGISDAFKKLTSQGIMSDFSGHSQITSESKILLLVKDGQEVDAADTGSEIEVVTETTPFYGEAGGQVGDTGKISGPDFEAQVTETIKDPTGLIIHKGKIVSGRIKSGETVTLAVDRQNRESTQRNHTATHILHAALRKVLGDHVKQAGSLVAPDRLRFDFSHFSQIDQESLDKIEDLVNERIRENVSTQTVEMDAEDAFKSGAMALFEEKYGEKVRVVSLADFSKELCGGTHVKSTGDIGLFKIVGESSVASGVRRIEALTGKQAVAYTQQISQLLNSTAHLVKETPDAVPQKIEKLISENKVLEKQVESLKAKVAAMSTGGAEHEMKNVNGVRVLAKRVIIDNPAALRDLADQIRDKVKSGIIVLGSIAGDRALLIAVVTKDLVDRYHAGNIVKELATVVGGSGGGRPDMAQAGGTRPENLDQALAKVYEVIGKV